MSCWMIEIVHGRCRRWGSGTRWARSVGHHQAIARQGGRWKWGGRRQRGSGRRRRVDVLLLMVVTVVIRRNIDIVHLSLFHRRRCWRHVQWNHTIRSNALYQTLIGLEWGKENGKLVQIKIHFLPSSSSSSFYYSSISASRHLHCMDN